LLSSSAPGHDCIQWTQTIYFPDYEVGSQPYVQVTIYNGGKDDVDEMEGEQDKPILGQCNFNIFEVLEKSKEAGEGLNQSLDYGRGSITMYAHESQTSTIFDANDVAKSHVPTSHRRRMLLQFRALNVKNIEGTNFSLGLGRSDPFFCISKKHNNPETGRIRWQRVYKSQVIMNHLNPLWEEFHIHLDDLCDDDLNRPLRMELWDYESTGNHRLMGQVEVSPNILMARKSRIGNADRSQSLHFHPSEDAKRGNARYDVVGELIVLQAKIL